MLGCWCRGWEWLSPDSVAGASAPSPSPFGRPSGARLFSALVQSPKKSKLVSAREEEEEEEEEEETKADDEEERLGPTQAAGRMARVQDMIPAHFEARPNLAIRLLS